MSVRFVNSSRHVWRSNMSAYFGGEKGWLEDVDVQSFEKRDNYSLVNVRAQDWEHTWGNWSQMLLPQHAIKQ